MIRTIPNTSGPRPGHKLGPANLVTSGPRIRSSALMSRPRPQRGQHLRCISNKDMTEPQNPNQSQPLEIDQKPLHWHPIGGGIRWAFQINTGPAWVGVGLTTGCIRNKPAIGGFAEGWGTTLPIYAEVRYGKNGEDTITGGQAGLLSPLWGEGLGSFLNPTGFREWINGVRSTGEAGFIRVGHPALGITLEYDPQNDSLVVGIDTRLFFQALGLPTRVQIRPHIRFSLQPDPDITRQRSFQS